MLRDSLFALQRLARAPGFSLLAVATLALAIGAHVAIFGFADALLLRPLPVAAPEELVGVYETRDGAGFLPLSLPDYLDHRQATRVFTRLAAHYPTAPLSLAADDRLEEVNGSVVSADYFPVLGVVPERGRFFLAAEDAAGRPPVAVVSHSFWRSRLAGADEVLGSSLELNGVAFTVVGIAPEGFAGVLPGTPSEVWIPLSAGGIGYRWCEVQDRDCTWLQMIGRLAPGRTLGEAAAEMRLLGAAVHLANPRGGGREHGGIERGLAVAPLAAVHPAARPAIRRLSLLLLASVSLLLAVAAINLAGLLFARGLMRRREVATRLALGAARWRVVWLFVAEALILSAAGGALGLLVATWLGPVVGALHRTDAPIDLAIGPSVALYATALSMVTGALVGTVSGLRALRPGLAPAIRESRRSRLLGALVVAQVALSFVLLAGTGLLVRSASSFDRVGALDSSRVATLRLRPRLAGYEPQRAQELQRQVIRRLEALPGVEAVSLSAGLPPLPFFNPVPVALPAELGGEGARRPEVWADRVGPGLFATLGIPLVSGREFDRSDRVGAAAVAIVNQALARSLWPEVSPVGRRLVLAERSFEVVGVVRDAGFANLEQGSILQVYTPYWQDPGAVDARLSVRVAGDAERAIPALRRAVHELAPDVPISETESLRARFEREFAAVYLTAKVLAVSGGLALFLAAIGLYGALALLVAQRARDIGIRMALGSSRGRVASWVLRDAGRLVGIAFAVGLGVVLLASRGLGEYLYGVGPYDLPTLASALAALAAVAALAAWWPARRASRVDPLVAIRNL